MPKRLCWQLCLAVAATWTMLTAGCGPSTPTVEDMFTWEGWAPPAAPCPMLTVEGTVTWDGTPVETGTISFLPADGKGPSFGGELKNGSYRVEAAKPAALGAKNVTIMGVRKTGKMIEAGPPAPEGTMVDELLSISSTEKCEIVDGENKHNFELKSAAK